MLKANRNINAVEDTANFLKFVSMDELIKIRDKYLALTLDMIDFNKFNQFAIVHHSNSIEGSTLTLEETYLLLNDGLTPANKPSVHTLMAIDHLNALKYMHELAESKKPLTLANTQHLSSLILKNTGGPISMMGGEFDSSKGEFRKGTVRAGDTTFVNYLKVDKLVKELVDHINKNINTKDFEQINKLAFDAHFQMVSIHPFADGNGRISRLLMNYVQMYQKQPLSIVFSQDKAQYIDALQKTRKKEDINIFHQFMFSQTKKHLIKEISNFQKEPKQKRKGNGMSFLF